MKLSIIKYTEDKPSTLRLKSIKVTEFTDAIKSFCENVLIASLIEHDAAGLSASQIGSNARIIAIKGPRGPVALINPVIVERSSAKKLSKEECLSIPGRTGLVLRHKYVVVQAQSVTGEKFKIKFIDRLAAVVQHEIDLLDGVMFIDKLSFV